MADQQYVDLIESVLKLVKPSLVLEPNSWPEEAFLALGLDSLDSMTVLLKLHKDFGLVLEAEHLEQITCPRDVITIMSEQKIKFDKA